MRHLRIQIQKGNNKGEPGRLYTKRLGMSEKNGFAQVLLRLMF